MTRAKLRPARRHDGGGQRALRFVERSAPVIVCPGEVRRRHLAFVGALGSFRSRPPLARSRLVESSAAARTQDDSCPAKYFAMK